ncbi:MAG TPA: NAD(P)H-dependent glycerol-3-phosphate dehydrogenase [Xanthobacteraceae bacterium]|nr:NAD(P)H-dependent glycerol-3-phosphate dehydrogenase [Xanthobacteraceae bacterium]
MSRFAKIAVLGAGAWGTALANTSARAGRDVVLWGRDPNVLATMTKDRVSPRLPGIQLDDHVAIASTLGEAAQSDAMLIVVPAQSLNDVATLLAPVLRDGTPVIACAKGIERGTGRFMTEIIAQALPNAVPAILSGPSFASDVARGLPTAVTLATADETLAAELTHALGSATFRPYHSTDVRGVEIGGAAKNVFAIAAGIVSGRKLGASAASALTTRGFAELVRLGKSFGAKSETLTGLSGLGDLILSCSSRQSRNFSLGIALGEGQAHADVLAQAGGDGKLAEGAFTASVLVEIAQKHGVDMPIATAISHVLDGSLSVGEAIESLLTRPFRAEA